MRRKNYMWLLVGLICVSLLAPVLVAAAPVQQQNLLANPGFEGGWHWQGDSFLGKVADDWVAWWVDDATGKSESDPDFWKNQRPEYGLIGLEYYKPDQVHGGAQALQYGKRYATHTAGAYQQVSGITPGSKLLFSAWGFVFGSDKSKTPGWVHMKVGIDPTGGTNVFSGNVVWSPEYNPIAVNSGSAWQQMSVEAVAQNSTVTVFVYSSPDWPMDDGLTSQWDDTSLVVTGTAEEPTATPPPPLPTNTPGPPPPPAATSTPRPDGSVVHKVQSGETLWAIAIQYSSGSTMSPEQMLERINQLNNNPALIYPGQELVVAVPQNPLPVATTAPAGEGESASAETESEAQPTEGAAEEPAAEASAALATSSTVCVLAYHDRNTDGMYDAATEELVPNAGFTLSNESGVVGSYTSDGVSEPYCFSQLIPGTYMVQLARPGGYSSVTSEYWAVPLPGGATANVQFGVRPDPNAPDSEQTQAALGETRSNAFDNILDAATAKSGENTEEEGTESKGLLSRLGEIAIGISGIFVLLLAVAVGVAFVASRRRA